MLSVLSVLSVLPVLPVLSVLSVLTAGTEGTDRYLHQTQNRGSGLYFASNPTYQKLAPKFS